MDQKEKIEFFAPMERPPTVTAQDHHRVGRTKTGKPVVYRDQRLRAARHTLETAFQAARPPKSGSLAEGPVHLTIGLIYPYRSADRAARKQDAAVWKTSRPDLDNQSKEITDALMSCGYIRDDSQVAHLTMYKLIGPTPGIYIKVELAENPDSFLQQVRKLAS